MSKLGFELSVASDLESVGVNSGFEVKARLDEDLVKVRRERRRAILCPCPWKVPKGSLNLYCKKEFELF